jgi:hypothetical protein
MPAILQQPCETEKLFQTNLPPAFQNLELRDRAELRNWSIPRFAAVASKGSKRQVFTTRAFAQPGK